VALEIRLLRLLAKLELSTSFALQRCADQLEHINPDLSRLLAQQSRSEYGHYVLISGLATGAAPRYRRWIKAGWSSGHSAGQIVPLTQRLLMFRVLLRGRSIHDLAVLDQLAVLGILEELQAIAYRILGVWCPLLASLAIEEKDHAVTLWAIAELPPLLSLKWWLRSLLALLFLPVDIVRLINE
jgi:hypothetical protein